MFQNERPKASSISPTTLRLAPELRARLSREATIAGHSLTAEIERRLEDSFRAQDPKPTRAATTGEPPPAWSPQAAPALSEHQRLLLRAFAQLSPDRQLALLTLLA